jgi:hypothetical protein
MAQLIGIQGIAWLARKEPRLYEFLRQLVDKLNSLLRPLPRGTATLVAGTVTIQEPSVTRATRIMLSVQTLGGTPGYLFAPLASVVERKSFVILSSSATDTSTVVWEVI